MSDKVPPELPALAVGLREDGRWHVKAFLEGGRQLDYDHSFPTRVEALALARQKAEGCLAETGVTLAIFEGSAGE